MKLLFLVDQVDYPFAPNPVLARRTAGQLAAMGHMVHLLELYDGQTLPPDPPEGCRAFLLPFADERKMNQALEHGDKNGSPVPLRLARLAMHPTAVAAAVRQIVLHHPRRIDACRAMVEQLDERYHYDAVFSVNAPFPSAQALRDAAIGGKKLAWMMDPLTGGPASQGPDAEAVELSLCQKLDKLLITPQMATHLSEPGCGMAAYRRKLQVVEFPCMVPPPVPPVPKEAGNRRVRCAFVGTLYPVLRTPHYALELFRCMNDPDLELVFAGDGWQHYAATLPDSCRRVMGDRLQILGQIPFAQAQEEIAKADVLINLGNRENSQLPSKIFEIFSSGKPVLNLAKRPDDVSLPYFERYPLACTVLEREGPDLRVCARVRAFLHKNAGRQLPFAQAEALFRENTPGAVAQALLDAADGC